MVFIIGGTRIMAGRPPKPKISIKRLDEFSWLYGKIILQYPDLLNDAIRTKKLKPLVDQLKKMGLNKNQAYEYAKTMIQIASLTLNIGRIKALEVIKEWESKNVQ